MQGNKSEDTKPELLARRHLRAVGLTGYRLHWKKAPGSPDICFPGRHVAIFINGCFWHRCPYCNLPLPGSNTEYWQAKFARNRERDYINREKLTADGWTVVVVWECALAPSRIGSTMQRVDSVVIMSGKARDEGRLLPGRIVEAGFMPIWFRRRMQKRHCRRRQI